MRGKQNFLGWVSCVASIPVSDEPPESIAEDKFYLIIHANDWEEFNPAEFEIVINLEGREYIADLPDSVNFDQEVKFGSYYSPPG